MSIDQELENERRNKSYKLGWREGVGMVNGLDHDWVIGQVLFLLPEGPESMMHTWPGFIPSSCIWLNKMNASPLLPTKNNGTHLLSP